MDSESIYLLDANVFIEAHQRYYAFDIVPTFWQKLIELGENRKIISIDRVKSELERGHKTDPLCKWVKQEFSVNFKSTDDTKVFAAYGKIITWVTQNQQFLDPAKSEFGDAADSWLIAYALAYNHTIVTHEIYNKDKRNRVLIPVVCREFGIPYINTFDMLRKCQSTI